jgi:hypothetical protein
MSLFMGAGSFLLRSILVFVFLSSSIILKQPMAAQAGKEGDLPRFSACSGSRQKRKRP